ncbi:MAG: YebC/PmpR family DNA-binding transcriptional regulator [Candidatus Gottesmanbacteria bacterium]|nr:YebC/PmpR family DNA-binding transcriptional regulator [Candidatus Gottesmanbacteria bacterium]
MSGHSKWSKVKHQKATTDVVKSFAFTKASHAITVAVKEGGGITDPVSNFHLRLAVEKAHAVNMPKENIERAIAKAAGEGAAAIEQIMYEGYGPGGVAILIHAATDKRQRTVSQIKNVLERAGGTLVSPGGVNFLFERRGTIIEPKQGMGIALNEEQKRRTDALIKELEELDDVQTVFTNLL